MNRTAGHGGKADLTVVDGHIRIANGGNACAHAHKVVIALPFQTNSRPVDGIAALAVHYDARKIRGVGGNEHVIGLGIRNGALLHRSGHALSRHQLAVLDADRRLQRDLALPAHRGIDGLDYRLRHGDGHISMVAARHSGVDTAVDGQAEVLALGCL